MLTNKFRNQEKSDIEKANNKNSKSSDGSSSSQEDDSGEGEDSESEVDSEEEREKKRQASREEQKLQYYIQLIEKRTALEERKKKRKEAREEKKKHQPETGLNSDGQPLPGKKRGRKKKIVEKDDGLKIELVNEHSSQFKPPFEEPEGQPEEKLDDKSSAKNEETEKENPEGLGNLELEKQNTITTKLDTQG